MERGVTTPEGEANYSPELELLEKGVESVLNERDFPEYLKTVSRLHQYSYGNISLIHMQNPEATMVAGYRAWQEMGRQVQKGERGMTILVPWFRRKVDEETGELTKKLTGFGTGKVFDVGQTEGDPVNESIPYMDAGENMDTAFRLCDAMMRFFQDENVYVQPDTLSLTDEKRGSYNWLFKTVKYRPGMPGEDLAKTLVHEGAHHIVFTRPHSQLPRNRKEHEIVAEGASFVVCSRYGLDTGDYSFRYISGWSERNIEDVKANLNAIQKTAHELITSLEDPKNAWIERHGNHERESK